MCPGFSACPVFALGPLIRYFVEALIATLQEVEIMRSSWLIVLLALGVCVLGFGETIKYRTDNEIEFDYFREEMDRLLAEKGARQVGSLTLEELHQIAGELSISIQKTYYIEKSRHASMMMPGLGQFRNGDTLNGVLFTTANVLTLTGAFLGAYFLLPEDVQFHETNPFTDDISDVRRAWGDHSFVEYLPSIGGFLGGVALNILVRILSANHAENLARKNIENGRVEFDPYPSMGYRRGLFYGAW